jgi:phage terminase large subunit GpA-like protein
MNYKEQLLSSEWKDKRIIILQRDNFECRTCGSNKKLQVHHKSYTKSKMAWEYKNSNLITLCESCHIKIHKKRSISSFFGIQKNCKKINKTISKIEANLDRIKRLTDTLSKRDKELQIRYDKLKINK